MQVANGERRIAKPASVGRKAERAAITLCILLIATASSANATTFSFDDIDYWVGSGANRAALVIDWVEGAAEPHSLAWGYRWDGAASGRDMLLAVIAADPRLFGKLGGTPTNATAVYGIGYDADDDGNFEIDDGTTFNGDGMAFTGPDDLAMATDPDDYYAEGWFTGFWHYGIAPTNPYESGSWIDTQLSMANRVLTDGSWDSWAYETTTFPPFDAYAQNPVAALPPGGVPSDFDRDGEVNGNDYGVWRRSFGSATAAADASGNGLVDAADYAAWRKFSVSQAGAGAAMVPEPALIVVLIGLFAGVSLVARKRKERTL